MMTASPTLIPLPIDSRPIAADPPRSEPAQSPSERSFRRTLEERRTPSSDRERAENADDKRIVSDADDRRAGETGAAPAAPAAEQDARDQAADQSPYDDHQPAAEAPSEDAGRQPADDAAAQQPVAEAQPLPAANALAVEPETAPAARDSGDPALQSEMNREPALREGQDRAPVVTVRQGELPAPVQTGETMPAREQPSAPSTPAPTADQAPTQPQSAPTGEQVVRAANAASAAVDPQPRAADASARPAMFQSVNAAAADQAQQIVNQQATADASTSGGGDRDKNSEQQLGARRSAAPIAPAAARAMQVETAVQLENLTGQTPSGDAASRLAGPAPVTMSGQGAVTLSGPVAEQSGASATSSAHLINENDFSSRIVRGLTAMINQRGGVMNMRLTPPDLGDLRVQMSITQGTVSAQFIASTEQASMLLDRSLTVLRAALESHGLTVERLGVQVASSEQSNAARHEANNQQNAQQQSQQHNAADGESRGRQDPGDGRYGREAPADFAASLDELDAALPSFAEASHAGGESS